MGVSPNVMPKVNGSIQAAAEKKKMVSASDKAAIPSAASPKEGQFSVKEKTPKDIYLEKMGNYHNSKSQDFESGDLNRAIEELNKRGTHIEYDLNQDPKMQWHKKRFAGAAMDLIKEGARKGIKSQPEFEARYDELVNSVADKDFLKEGSTQMVQPNFKKAVSRLYLDQYRKHGDLPK